MNKTLLLLMTTCALGCAHYPAPTEQVAKSMAAVRGAEEAGAAGVPQAALQMRLAQEELQQAKQLMEKDDNRRAEDKAQRASQDAELAVVLAHAHTAETKLAQFQSTTAGGEAPPANGAAQ